MKYKKMTHVDNPFKSPAVLSFCPGVLGLERGLTRAIGKLDILAYVEIEAFIIANLVAGMEAGVVDPAPVWTDAKTFDASPFRGKVHGIIGGYPCPGESRAGLLQGHLYKGFIWPHIRRSIAAARPLWCFFENVGDHLTGTFPIVLRSLHNLGYRVEADVFTAQEVGSPQERQRVFILAVADTNGASTIGNLGRLLQTCKKTPGTQQGKNRKRMRNEFKYSSSSIQEITEKGPGYTNNGEKLGHPQISGLEGLRSARKQGSKKNGKASLSFSTSFPMGQGFEQYQWEEPREIESSLGCAVNVYNFREDLLLANGNSVVEQTAEIAFINLLNKHSENLK